jgi:hypothetical protein
VTKVLFVLHSHDTLSVPLPSSLLHQPIISHPSIHSYVITNWIKCFSQGKESDTRSLDSLAGAADAVAAPPFRGNVAASDDVATAASDGANKSGGTIVNKE